MRYYTPRCFDAGSLAFDSTVRAADPAKAWALSMQLGNVL